MADDEGTKQFLLRIPRAMAADLEQARWAQHMDMTEIVLQGLALRLYAIAPGRLFEILDRIGYEGKQKPGRPPRQPAPAAAPAASAEVDNKDVQVKGVEEPAAGQEEDLWNLETDPALSTNQPSSV